MTPQEQKAFDAMRDALEQITPELRGLGIVSDIALSYAGIASSALVAAKAVSDVPETNFGNIVQPQAQGDDSQICDEQRRALIAYGDARESKDPDAIATAFVNALHTLPQARKPLTTEQALGEIWNARSKWMEDSGIDTEGMQHDIPTLYAMLPYFRAAEAAHGIKE